MSLTHEEVERCILQICTGEKIVLVEDKSFLLRHPDIIRKSEADHLYDIEYDIAIKDGLLSNDDMGKLISERNLITPENERELVALRSKIEAQQTLLAKTIKVKANQARIKGILSDLNLQVREIEYKRSSKFVMTANARAEEAKILYLCWASCYDFNTRELHWLDYKAFKDEFNYLLRQHLMFEFTKFYSGISTVDVRFIARSNLWRVRYVTSLKTSESLFGVPSAMYTNDMLNLAYWSHYYQNIYEMMPDDQPSEDIIEDDEALDAYLKSYYDEKSRESTVRQHRARHGEKLSAFSSEEVLVTRTNELYEDIEFDKPKESALIKDKAMIRKRTRRG